MTDAKTLLPGFEERFGDVKGGTLRWFVGGEGPPLVLVHGLGGAASNWAELAPALARRYRVLVPELPGHGGSAPLPAVAGLDAFADRVAAAAGREKLLPAAAVVGHSLGGVVALRLAIRSPQDVSSVVLAASAGIASSTRLAQALLTVVTFVQPGKRIRPFRDAVSRSPLLRTLTFGHWGASDPPALSVRAAAGFLAGPPLHTDTASAARALIADDPRTYLEGVRCRSLVLWGARDNQVPLDDAFEYARRLGAELRVIPDCGHLLIGERPDACFDAIESFLHGVREVDELPLDPEASR